MLVNMMECMRMLHFAKGDIMNICWWWMLQFSKRGRKYWGQWISGKWTKHNPEYFTTLAFYNTIVYWKDYWKRKWPVIQEAKLRYKRIRSWYNDTATAFCYIAERNTFQVEKVARKTTPGALLPPFYCNFTKSFPFKISLSCWSCCRCKSSCGQWPWVWPSLSGLFWRAWRLISMSSTFMNLQKIS